MNCSNLINIGRTTRILNDIKIGPTGVEAVAAILPRVDFLIVYPDVFPLFMHELQWRVVYQSPQCGHHKAFSG